MNAAREIASAMAEITRDEQYEAARVRYRKALAAARTLPSGVAMNHSQVEIMREYEEAAQAVAHFAAGDDES